METQFSSSFKILSIDGGGIRGVVPAHILKCFSSKLAVKPMEHFQMFAGTSTGSIIAASIVCGIDIDRVLNLYKELGSLIFENKTSVWPKFVRSAVQSQYTNKGLKDALNEVFSDIKLGDIKTPLILPATDIGYGGVHVFKSGYSKEFNRDLDVYVKDAVLASCSAPTFFDPVKVGEYALTDGGLWANNPSLCAFIDAQKRLNVAIDSIKVLSIGTGDSRTFYGTNVEKKWGLLNGWRHKEFIGFMLSLQSQATQNYLQLMMKEGNLLRLNFDSDLPFPMDDHKAVSDLVSRADRLFTHNSEKIKCFLNL